MIPVFILVTEEDDRRSKVAEAYIRYSQHLISVASLVLYGKNTVDDEEQTQAEDVVQDAFKYVLEKDDLPEDPEQARALLTIITKHKAIDILRKRDHLADNEPTESQLGYSMPKHSSRLSLTIDALPDIYKEVILLHYAYGYKATEIANMLDLDYNTVLKRLERARKLAKEQYLKDE